MLSLAGRETGPEKWHSQSTFGTAVPSQHAVLIPSQLMVPISLTLIAFQFGVVLWSCLHLMSLGICLVEKLPRFSQC